MDEISSARPGQPSQSRAIGKPWWVTCMHQMAQPEHGSRGLVILMRRAPIVAFLPIRIISGAAGTNAGRLFSGVERHELFQYVRRSVWSTLGTISSSEFILIA
jgi:hypothetical protein